MLFSFYLIFAESSIYGIDFGSHNVRISVAVPGKPVTILLNEEGSRSTPNYLTIDPVSSNQVSSKSVWVVGRNAERIYYKNSSYGIKNPFDALINGDYEFEGIDSISLGAIAFSLHLKQFRTKRDKLVITVPSVVTPTARRRIIQTLNLLNISSAQILDSNSAVATLYSVERMKKSKVEGENVTENVIFIDIGAVQAEVSNWKFERNGGFVKIELLDYRFSDEIGGDYIDNNIFNYVKSKLPREPTKAEIKVIYQAIVKAKERLATGIAQKIDLTEDFGISIDLSTEIIDEISKDVLNKLSTLLENITVSESIELIGGSTRLPSFNKIIQQFFPDTPLRRSLNSDEAIAFGASYYSSIQTGTITGTKIDFIKPSIYGIDFNYNDKNLQIIESGDSSERKSITMRRFKDFNFSLYSTKKPSENIKINSKIYNSLEKEYSIVDLYSLTYLTRNITKQLAKGTKPFIRINFGHSQIYDCVDYMSSTLTANISVNVSIKGEMNSINSTSVNLNIKSNVSLTKTNYNLTKDVLFIKDYINETNERKKHDEIYNKLESFIIDLQDKISYDSDFQGVTTEEEREEIYLTLSRERTALDFSGLRASSSELEKRYDKLEEKLHDIIFRYKEFQQRPLYIIKLKKAVQKSYKLLEIANASVSVIEDFKNLVNKTEEMIKDAENIKPLDVPKLFVKDLQEQERRLLRKFSSLTPRRINKPTRTPVPNVNKSIINNETNPNVTIQKPYEKEL